MNADVKLMVDRAKREINEDIATGRVPPTVASFAELHDHVDANTYGGLDLDAGGALDELMPHALQTIANAAQNELDAWIKAGRPVTEACPGDPTCPCRRRVEALPTVTARRSGRPSCGCKHRALLGTDAEVVERLETPTGPALRAGRPSANVAVMWRFYTTSVYADSDLPVLCIRECLQNATDAIDMAVRHRQIKRADGRFSVEWSSDGTLTIDDNGYGMDPDTFFGKFLVIGESGKRAGDVSSAEGGGGKGGFGVAKAVILGTSATFRWKIHSRDKVYVAEGFDADVKMYDAPMRQGTSIVLYDVPQKFHSYYLRSAGRYVGIIERLRWLLALNDLDVTLDVNGQAVPRYFRRTAGSAMKLSESWGPETKATAKVYKRGDKGGAYYIRLNGLFQFYKPSIRGRMKGDVVIDLETGVRPDDPRGLPYPLNAARDGFTREAALAFDEIVGYAEVESESLTEDREYDVLEATADSDEEREGAAEVAQASRQALTDPEVMRALRDAAGGVDRFYQEQVAAHKGASKDRPVESAAPGAPKGLAGAAEVVSGPVASGTQALTELITHVLSSADAQRVAQGGASGSVLTADVQGYLHELVEKGENIDADPGFMRRIIEDALDRAENAAIGPGGGGMLQGVGVEQARRALDALLPATVDKRPARPRNPFGAAGAVLIAKKRYSRGKARRFLTNYARWVPFLVAWDATLRMIAHEIRMRAPFVAGFVLDDSVAGLAQSQGGRISILINPDVYQGVVKSAHGRPLVLATFLHSVACHELAHANGGMGHGHDEEFVKYREHYAVITAHLLPVIAAMAQRALQLTESVEQAEVRRLRDRLAKLQADLSAMKKAQKGAAPRRRRTTITAGQVLSPTAPPRTEASDLLDLIAGGMIAAPPEGVDPEYVVVFFSRMRATLLTVVETELAEARVEHHTRRWSAEEEAAAAGETITSDITLDDPPWTQRFSGQNSEVYEHQKTAQLVWSLPWTLPDHKHNRRWYLIEPTLGDVWRVRYYDSGSEQNHWLHARTGRWMVGSEAVAGWSDATFATRKAAADALRTTTGGPRILAPVDAVAFADLIGEVHEALPSVVQAQAPGAQHTKLTGGATTPRRNAVNIASGLEVEFQYGWGKSATMLRGTVRDRYLMGDHDEWIVETEKGRMAVRESQLRPVNQAAGRVIAFGPGRTTATEGMAWGDEQRLFAGDDRDAESGRWSVEGLPAGAYPAFTPADESRLEERHARAAQPAYTGGKEKMPVPSGWTSVPGGVKRSAGDGVDRYILRDREHAPAFYTGPRRVVWRVYRGQPGAYNTVELGAPDSFEEAVKLATGAVHEGAPAWQTPPAPAARKFRAGERVLRGNVAWNVVSQEGGIVTIVRGSLADEVPARELRSVGEPTTERLSLGDVARTVAAGAQLVAAGHDAVFREAMTMPSVAFTIIPWPRRRLVSTGNRTTDQLLASQYAEAVQRIGDASIAAMTDLLTMLRTLSDEPRKADPAQLGYAEVVLGYVYGVDWATLHAKHGVRKEDFRDANRLKPDGEGRELLTDGHRAWRFLASALVGPEDAYQDEYDAMAWLRQAVAVLLRQHGLLVDSIAESLPRVTRPAGLEAPTRGSRRPFDYHTILRGVIPAWAWSRLWIDHKTRKGTWLLRSTNFSRWEIDDLLGTVTRGLGEYGARVSRGTGSDDVLVIIEEPTR